MPQLQCLKSSGTQYLLMIMSQGQSSAKKITSLLNIWHSVYQIQCHKTDKGFFWLKPESFLEALWLRSYLHHPTVKDLCDCHPSFMYKHWLMMMWIYCRQKYSEPMECWCFFTKKLGQCWRRKKNARMTQAMNEKRNSGSMSPRIHDTNQALITTTLWWASLGMIQVQNTVIRSIILWCYEWTCTSQ